MPAFISLPPSLRMAGVVGYVECIGLITYAISIAAFEQGGSTSGISGSGADLAPAVLIGLYVAFAALVFLVTTLLLRGSKRAFTPYLLVQAFGLVVAQPLLAGEGTRLPGLIVLALVLSGAVAVLRQASRSALQ